MIYQTRKDSRHTVRWPDRSIPLPNCPGDVMPVDLFGPLSVTAQGNQQILPSTDRFSRRAAMYAMTAAEFTDLGVAKFLVNRHISSWGCSLKLFSDNGPVFSELTRSVHHLIGVQEVAKTSCHAIGNGSTEHVDHAMAQMLAYVVNKRQHEWDRNLPHIEYSYNNSMNAATGLTPSELYSGCLSRFSIANF